MENFTSQMERGNLIVDGSVRLKKQKQQHKLL